MSVALPPDLLAVQQISSKMAELTTVTKLKMPSLWQTIRRAFLEEANQHRCPSPGCKAKSTSNMQV
jgi:hypothetical protein